MKLKAEEEIKTKLQLEADNGKVQFSYIFYNTFITHLFL